MDNLGRTLFYADDYPFYDFSLRNKLFVEPCYIRRVLFRPISLQNVTMPNMHKEDYACREQQDGYGYMIKRRWISM